MPNVITAMALRERGGAVVTLRSGIHFLDFKTGALEVLSPLASPPPFVFNDGKVDRHGRFVIGASTANFANPAPDGGLYSLEVNHDLKVLDTGVHFSNGPCWSPDFKTFYFSDSWLYTTYAYELQHRDRRESPISGFSSTPEISVDCPMVRPWIAMVSSGSRFFAAARLRPSGPTAASRGSWRCLYG